MPLNPKFQKYLAALDLDAMYALGVDKMRAYYQKAMAEGKVKEEVGEVEDRTVKTSVRDTLIRVYRPKAEGNFPVMIWLHGGGFVLGDIEHGDFLCRRMTNNANCTCISVEYGLCPPHKFPEPENECFEIVKWVFENANELNIDKERICIAGDSVGGTMAAAICHRLRDEEKEMPVYQIIIYANLDPINVGKRKSRDENGKGYRLTEYGIGWFNGHHFNSDDDGLNPVAAPLLSKNFKGLPPALIITAEFDPLRDESIDYAKCLNDAGVEAYLKNYLGIIHGFLGMNELGLPEIDDALNLMSNKLKYVFNKD